MGRLILATRIYLDANVFIDALEGLPEHADRMLAFFSAFRARPMQTVASELVLGEVMGKESAKIGWARQSRFFLDLIVRGRFIDLWPVSRGVLWATGDLRRQAKSNGRSLRLPDAIHIATAKKAGCSHVPSADQRLPLSSSMQRLDPNELDLEQIEQLLDA